MDPDSPELTVTYSRMARVEMGEIWDWNAEQYGAVHATQYLRFLETTIDQLGTGYLDGRPVEERPGLFKLPLRKGRSRADHSHVAIYRVDLARHRVIVLHVFHTAQNIAGRIEE